MSHVLALKIGCLASYLRIQRFGPVQYQILRQWFVKVSLAICYYEKHVETISLLNLSQLWELPQLQNTNYQLNIRRTNKGWSTWSDYTSNLESFSTSRQVRWLDEHKTDQVLVIQILPGLEFWFQPPSSLRFFVFASHIFILPMYFLITETMVQVLRAVCADTSYCNPENTKKCWAGVWHMEGSGSDIV